MELPQTKPQLPGDTSLPTSNEALAKLFDYATGEAQYSIEDFFRNPEKSSYQLSPDGQYFSYMGPFERRQNIFIQKIGAAESVRITSEVDRDISWYFWTNDRRIVYLKDNGGDENYQLYAVDIDGKNSKDLTPFEGVRINVIDELEDMG